MVRWFIDKVNKGEIKEDITPKNFEEYVRRYKYREAGCIGWVY